MSQRTIAIGDVHGCSLALATLIEAIQPDREDLLVPLGDYIDRGPDSRGVLNLLLALGERCHLVPILGNHEEMLLVSLYQQSMRKLWLEEGGAVMLASYGVTAVSDDWQGLANSIPKEHWEFIVNCRPFHETETHLFLHAGYVCDLPLGKQPPDALRWQFTNARTARPHFSGKIAIVGHTPQRSGTILDLGFLKCIDTACQKGKWLTGLDVGTGEFWQTNERGKVRTGRLACGSPDGAGQA